uniref:Putative secreted protein n=1 Tax=Anopheles triannulatus TaxID=58253 RepID=A0A2M4B446_9DIPT
MLLLLFLQLLLPSGCNYSVCKTLRFAALPPYRLSDPHCCPSFSSRQISSLCPFGGFGSNGITYIYSC